MPTTPKLEIPTLTEKQFNAEVTVNSALHQIDTILTGVVESRTETAPPSGAVPGDAYLVDTGDTGTDWAGQDGKYAYLNPSSVWLFITPWEGMILWVKDENILLVYDGAVWDEISVSTVTNAVGELYVYGNSGGTPQTVGTAFTNVTQWANEGLSTNTSLSLTNGEITALVAGQYFVSCCLSFSGTSLATFTLAIAVNGTEVNNIRCSRKLGTGGDVGSAAIGGVLNLSLNDDVSLSVKSDSTGDSFLIWDANLTIHKG